MSTEISLGFSAGTLHKKSTLFECNGKRYSVIAIHAFHVAIIDGALEYSAYLFVRDMFGDEKHHGMYVTHSDEVEIIEPAEER